MSLYRDYDDKSFSDYKYEKDEIEDLDKKKKVRRQLEDKLEHRRLKEEFKDDFDELNSDFDWSEIDR